MQIADRRSLEALSLKDIPVKDRKLSVCAAYVAKNGRDLKHVPQHHRTVHIVTLATGSYAKAYLMAGSRVREDRTLALLAVRRGGLKVWMGVPAKLVDPELCLAAVRGCGSILRYVPSPLRSFDVCRAACVAGGAQIEEVPPEHLSESFFEDVALPNIPIAYRTKKHCLAGVAKKGNYIRYVPHEMMSFKVLKIALKNDPWASRYVDEPFRNNRFYKNARQKVARSGVRNDS